MPSSAVAWACLLPRAGLVYVTVTHKGHEHRTSPLHKIRESKRGRQREREFPVQSQHCDTAHRKSCPCQCPGIGLRLGFASWGERSQKGENGYTSVALCFANLCVQVLSHIREEPGEVGPGGICVWRAQLFSCLAALTHIGHCSVRRCPQVPGFLQPLCLSLTLPEFSLLGSFIDFYVPFVSISLSFNDTGVVIL